MDIQWSLIWTCANAAARKPVARRDAFADPLEGPDWEGLGWAALLISRLASRSRIPEKEPRKTQAVERFTATSVARSVCVS